MVEKSAERWGHTVNLITRGFASVPRVCHFGPAV